MITSETKRLWLRPFCHEDLDLILREVERSDNESLRAKKEIMIQFIRTRFYELPEDADLSAAFEEFSREYEQAEMEEFAQEHGIQYDTLREIMTEYVFSGNISDEAIRQPDHHGRRRHQ